jgi:DNA-binding GntR family transcriptional regulator
MVRRRFGVSVVPPLQARAAAGIGSRFRYTVNMEHIKPPSLSGATFADRAFEWLEAAIIKGDLAPATKLDEVSLAKSFGVSRGPIREAINRLEGKKLVERLPHIGARVATFSKGDLLEIFHVREALEGVACRLATERMSDTDIDDLQKLLEGHARQGGLKAGENYFQRPGDYDLHYRIINASENKKLIQMLIEDLYHQLRIYRYRSSSRKGRAREALQEHRDIVAAMRARDAGAAERLMRQHLFHARNSLEISDG